jgi:hypothetical protein
MDCADLVLIGARSTVASHPDKADAVGRSREHCANSRIRRYQ